MSHEDASPLVIWETSQACDLACPQCQASASPRRHGFELTTTEGIRLLEQIGSFGNPLLVFAGSDPLKRPDLFLLLRRCMQLGLRTIVSPSSTALLPKAAIQEFEKEGVSRMVIAMDDPSAPMFDCAMEALEEAREAGLETQVHTVVTRWNMYRLDELADRVSRARAKVWSLTVDDLTAEEKQEVFEDLYRVSNRASFDVRTTENVSYRKYLTHRRKGLSQQGEKRPADAGDARGFVFISYDGEIHPSGFLAVSAGNVRCDSTVEVYRNSSLFTLLRDADHGECGACEHRNICSGSRARAFALTSDGLNAPIYT